jgi:hypothetical protein
MAIEERDAEYSISSTSSTQPGEGDHQQMGGPEREKDVKIVQFCTLVVCALLTAYGSTSLAIVVSLLVKNS